MGELLISVQRGTPPAISGTDNLHTLALVEAVFRSAREHRMVELSEFATEERRS
jgi:predicted dehydrogenase